MAGHHGRQRSTNLLGKTAGIAGWALTGRYELMQAVSDATRVLVSGYGREWSLKRIRLVRTFSLVLVYNPSTIN